MDVNSVFVTGTLRRDPLSKLTEAGASQVTFTIEVGETASTGAAFTVFVPVESYGEAAAIAGTLHAGDSVLVSGKLKWTAWTDKQGQKRTSLCVLARLLKPIGHAGSQDATSGA